MRSVGYILLKLVTKPLSLLPLGFHRAVGKGLGRFLGSVLHYRRDVVIINLSKSFPEMSYTALRRTCSQFYEHFGKIVGETVWFGGATPEKLRRTRIVEIENPELLNSLYENGRSIMVLTSHTGNWELFGGYKYYAFKEELKIPENDLVAAYRKISKKSFDEFMGSNRIAPLSDKAHYDGYVETFNILRYAIRNRDRLKLYNFITDQYPYSKSSKVDVGDFLCQRTWSMDGGVALAARLGMSVVYMNMEEKPDGNYRMVFRTIAEDASSAAPSDMLRQYYSLLENDIKSQPWNYLWTHRRWKQK